MVFSYYVRRFPYSLVWHLLHFLKRTPSVVVYCSAPLDYVILEPVAKHLPPVMWVARDSATMAYLRRRGLRPKRMPSFPEAVIMCRHAAHRFPVKRIVKIGFRHGAYHFKQFAKVRYYNAFDLYFMTSTTEAEEARARGIGSAYAVGFPKLDPAFDGTYDDATLSALRSKAGINPSRKTVIFTATWDKSGMSAIDRWIGQVDSLTRRYNVLITVHPWTSRKYIKRLRNLRNAHYINDPDVLPFLLVSDVLVGDTSSIIAEFCALGKPIITFDVPHAHRTVPDVTAMLARISTRVTDEAQLPAAIEESLAHPESLSAERKWATEVIFDRLDGRAGKRAADAIRELLPSSV